MLGNHPLAGSPVAAIYTRLPGAILAEYGTYTLTGTAVSLRFVRKLQAAVGAYVLTGQDVAFILSFSQVAINRVTLVGTTAILASGVSMISNFMMTAGDTKTLVVTTKDASGNAVNITGSSIKWQAARSMGKASVLSKSTSSGIQITDGANGEFTVTLNPSDTEDLIGNYYHEAQITAADGTISTVLFGTMKINPALIEAT